VKVLEYLDEVEVAYALNHRIVRGLDYYTRTVFEVFAPGEEEGSQTALSGGGRYDGLVQLMGGQPTPAVGFAGGVERLIGATLARGFVPPKLVEPQVMIAQLGEEARRTALSLFERLREAGVHVVERFGRGGLKGQLEEANRLGVRYAVIIGQREIIDGTVLLRDMENGIQEVVDRDRLSAEVVKRLARQAEHHSQVDPSAELGAGPSAELGAGPSAPEGREAAS
jgi:histidyl-tRNA synthetase